MVEAAQVYTRLGTELSQRVFLDIPNFLEVIFQADTLHQQLDDIFRRASAPTCIAGYNTTRRRWRDYPVLQPGETEKRLYDPFCNIANLIRDFCSDASIAGSLSSNHVSWLNCSTRSPEDSDDRPIQVSSPPLGAFLAYPY